MNTENGYTFAYTAACEVGYMGGEVGVEWTITRRHARKCRVQGVGVSYLAPTPHSSAFFLPTVVSPPNSFNNHTHDQFAN